MALIDAPREPTPFELRIFGLLAATAFGLVGGLVLWRTGSGSAAAAIWALGGVGAVVYYALPPLRRLMFRAWMAVFRPVGWVLSHGAMAGVYYGVLTPVGWVVRRFRRDAMRRGFEAEAESYWVERRTTRDVERYLKQF